MANLTSEELRAKVHAILKGVDLSTTSAKKVRLQLEEDLNADLTARKEELGKIIQVNPEAPSTKCHAAICMWLCD